MSTCSPTVALVADTSSESPTSPGAVGGRACSRSRLIRGLTCAATAALPVSVTRTVKRPDLGDRVALPGLEGPELPVPRADGPQPELDRLGAGHRRVRVDAGALGARHDHEAVRGAEPKLDRERRRAPRADGEEDLLPHGHLVAVEGDGQLGRPSLLEHGERQERDYQSLAPPMPPDSRSSCRLRVARSSRSTEFRICSACSRVRPRFWLFCCGGGFGCCPPCGGGGFCPPPPDGGGGGRIRSASSRFHLARSDAGSSSNASRRWEIASPTRVSRRLESAWAARRLTTPRL